jgi:ATP-dependent DNA helicase RecG
LKEEHNSRPRDPKIAKACFMAGYIDAWGRGTLKIYNSCKEHGLPEPTIIEKDGGVMVTLLKTIPVNDGGTIGGTIGGAIGGTIEDLTDRQKEILELINTDSKLSIRKLAQTLDINNSAVQGHLDILREKGIIARIGGTRGYWKIMIKL